MAGIPAPEYLFVYGSLRSGSAHPMAVLLARCSRPVAAGTVRGRVHDLGSYPAAVLHAGDGALIMGELRELHPDTAEALLSRLDEYEGCSPPGPPPALFRRERTVVRLDDGRTLEAWIYVYARALP